MIRTPKFIISSQLYNSILTFTNTHVIILSHHLNHTLNTISTLMTQISSNFWCHQVKGTKTLIHHTSHLTPPPLLLHLQTHSTLLHTLSITLTYTLISPLIPHKHNTTHTTSHSLSLSRLCARKKKRRKTPWFLTISSFDPTLSTHSKT